MWGEIIEPPVKTHPSSHESEPESKEPAKPVDFPRRCDQNRQTETRQLPRDFQVRRSAFMYNIFRHFLVWSCANAAVAHRASPAAWTPCWQTWPWAAARWGASRSGRLSWASGSADRSCCSSSAADRWCSWRGTTWVLAKPRSVPHTAADLAVWGLQGANKETLMSAGVDGSLFLILT